MLGKFLGYGFEDLLTFVEKHFVTPKCHYCDDDLQVGSVFIGFKSPIERGGKFVFRNLEVCCGRCGTCKEGLDDQEFREMWQIMGGWPKPVRKLIVARLVAGARVIPATLPPVDSLEWIYESNKGELPCSA